MPRPPLTPPLVTDGHLPQGPVLSPDGRWAAYTVTPLSRTSASPTSTLWVAAADGGASPVQITDGTVWDHRPRWSADSEHLAFLSQRPGEDAPRLRRIHRDGSGPATLAGAEARLVDHLPLAGGALTAVVVRDPDTRSAAPRVWGAPEPHDRLGLFDARTGRVRTFPGERHVLEVAASPDGAALAVISRPGPALDPVHPRWDLHVVDPATGRVDALGEAGWDAHSPVWWHDGHHRHLAWLAMNPGPDGGQVVRDLPLTGDAGERPTDLTEGMDRCPVELAQADEGPPLALFAHGLDTEIHRLDTATLRFTPLRRSTGLLESLTCDRTGGRVAVVATSAHEPRQVYAGPVKAAPTRLTRLRPELDGCAWADQERLSYRARDGLALDGLLLTPVGATARQGPFPLVTWVHGGPYGRYADQFVCGAHAPAQWLAHAGYAVFLPNPRGGLGHGRAFAETVVGALGQGEWTDIEDGIDLLVDRGVADPGRLGIGGWSHGGTMAAWAVGRTDRFRAAVVGAGVSDWGMLAATGEYGAAEAGLSGSVGWEGPGPHPHDAVGPVSFTSRVRTPVLVLHGDQDTNVPVGQAVYLHRALRHHGVEHEFVTYPGEGHSVDGRENQIDMLRRTRAWFDARLTR
ncbi:dipeptidyl aminopeptidase/acylaminoacyl peptidase [Nocardiopsis sp. Huas11]|uniref:S9 family peptidase n=1 Tax=Nocardiopsis sp. Huas11 TaxID=2183912 RepID=UPI000EAF72F9|nr:prolyl oligopeptidase family serine peptidase [Nocardiopsis sp. Huas11]RKS08643.1 dipeptidyl aminopeptidase/acylaminoacyl peptidase [Nocardiopsis sp. Huas11]